MAVVQTLHVEPGATFNAVEFHYLNEDGVTPFPLTGYTARLVVKDDTDGTTILDKALTIGTGSVITPAMTATETALLANKVGRYVVKIAHTSGEPVVQIARGKVVPEPDEVF